MTFFQPGESIGVATTVALALVAAALTFVVRALPRRGLVYWGTDTWFHLKMADVMRIQGRIPDRVDEFLIGGTYDYPPALPRLLSFLPRRFAERYNRAVSPLADAVHGSLIFVFATWLWQDPWAGATAVVVYLLTPIAVIESAELGVRSTGAMLASVTLVAAILFESSGRWPWAACAMTAFAAAMLFHRMSTQCLAWTLCALSALTLQVSYVGIILGGAVLAVVASRGLYIRVLRGHLSELRFWRRNVHLRDDGDPMKLIFGSPGQRGDADSWRRRLRSLYGMIRHHPYVAAVPIVYAAGWQSSMTQYPFLLWVAAVYAAFAATTHMRPLRFLGQGYRYLGYAALAVSTITAGYAANFGQASWSVHLVIALLGIIAVRETVGRYQGIRNNSTPAITGDLWSMLEWVKRSPRDGILCLPLGLASAVAYFSEKRVLRHCSSQRMDRLSVFYPLVTRPLGDVAREFGASYILLDVRFTRREAPVIEGARAIREAGSYRLYEIVGESAGNAQVARSVDAVARLEGQPGLLVQPRTGGQDR